MRLRSVLAADLVVFFDHQSDPDAAHMAAFTVRDPGDRAAFDRRWERILTQASITARTIELDDLVIGHVLAHPWGGSLEVSYWLGRPYWGRGLATRALTFFVAEVASRPLSAHVAQDNLASRRVLERCGFVLVDTARAYAESRQTDVEGHEFRLDA